MKRVIGLLAAAMLATGCGGGKAKVDADQAAGKPQADETKSCIVCYMGQCGWNDVEIVNVADCAKPPEGAIVGESWAYTFSARYTNVFGERQVSENWIAVVGRAEGKALVKNCYDNTLRLVGGHRGDEKSATASLTPMAPADDLPAIVAPKP